MNQYLHNLALWAKGIRWLWTKRVYTVEVAERGSILYKPGWGPWSFLPVYLTTYLAGTLAGYGVVSLSRAWYDRRDRSRFARFMTRLLDWIFPGRHGMLTGPRLWGSVNLRDKS